MPLAPTASLLAALITPGLLYQDAAVPPPAAPAPAGDSPETTTPASPEAHKILRLPPTGGERRTADRADLAAAAKRITELTNEFRQKQELKPVTRNETLAQAAEKFGEYLAAENLFGHRAGGTTPSQRVEAVGYEYCSVRENLAYHFDTFGFTADKLAKASVDGWIESPGHRANLLAQDVSETGVGVVYDETNGRYFSVQLFALPESAAVSFEVENRTEGPQTYRIRGREYTLPARYVQTHTACTADPVTVQFGPAPAAERPPSGSSDNGSSDNGSSDNGSSDAGSSDNGSRQPAESPEETPPNDENALKLADGQVLILRPGENGGVDPEVWSPPTEEPAAGTNPPTPSPADEPPVVDPPTVER